MFPCRSAQVHISILDISGLSLNSLNLYEVATISFNNATNASNIASQVGSKVVVNGATINYTSVNTIIAEMFSVGVATFFNIVDRSLDSNCC